MNIYTKRNLKYVNQTNYYSKLHAVYPIKHNQQRTLPTSLRKQICQLWNEKSIKLESLCLYHLKRFPFDCPDADGARTRGFNKEPELWGAILNQLLKMTPQQIIKGACRPKQANRQNATGFKDFVDEQSFGNAVITHNATMFMNSQQNMVLNASDKKMASVAHQLFGYHHRKGLDFLARINGQYLFGEAKCIGAIGGHQNDQFMDALNTYHARRNHHIKATPVIIVDGSCYFHHNSKMYKWIRHSNKRAIIVSALYLPTLVKSFERKTAVQHSPLVRNQHRQSLKQFKNSMMMANEAILN